MSLASVYRDFATVRDFEEFIRQLPEDEEPPATPIRLGAVAGRS